jgi:hypothetical protein
MELKDPRPAPPDNGEPEEKPRHHGLPGKTGLPTDLLDALLINSVSGANILVMLHPDHLLYLCSNLIPNLAVFRAPQTRHLVSHRTTAARQIRCWIKGSKFGIVR